MFANMGNRLNRDASRTLLRMTNCPLNRSIVGKMGISKLLFADISVSLCCGITGKMFAVSSRHGHDIYIYIYIQV